MFHSIQRAGLIGCLAFMLCGCGNELSSLTGTVTIDGEPAPEGLAIAFQPLKSGSPSYASVAADGTFEAQFTFRKSGIEPGEHRVHLTPSEVSSGMPVIGPDGNPVSTPASEATKRFQKLPREYYQEIEVITIEPGANEKIISLWTKSPDEE